MNKDLKNKYLETLLSKNYSQYAIDNISKMCDDVTKRMINSYDKTHSGSGLLVGEVQSGKTSNFIALTLDVIDRDLFDIVVILGGVIKDLKNQTKERLEAFRGGNFTIFDVKPNATKQIAALKETLARDDEKYVIVCLKEKKNLDFLNKLLKDQNRRILIIDDESDQATPNNEKTQLNEFGEREVSDKLSRIHESIDTLKNASPNTFLLLVTATPYSNIIASSNYNISPKWGYVLKTGDGYLGLDDFHQEFDDYRDNKIRILPCFKNEDGKVDRLKANLGDAHINERSWFDQHLKNSVLSFVVGNIVFRKLENVTKNFEMLVHSHFKKVDHETIEKMIQSYFRTWETTVDDSTAELKKSSIRMELDLFLDQLPENKRENAKGVYEEIVNDAFLYLRNNSSRITIQINNSNNDSDKDLTAIINRGKDQIIIGADKIQRGITFENLRVVFMPRLAVQAQSDTILQRARWFGYRSEYFDYMTIILTKRLAWLFQGFVDVKEEINSFLTKNYDADINLRNIEKFIVVPTGDKKSRLTRKGINITEENISLSNSRIQKIPQLTSDLEKSEIDKLCASNYNSDFAKWKFVTKEVGLKDITKGFLKEIFNKLDYVSDVDVFINHCEKQNIETITFTLMNFNMEKNILETRIRSLKDFDSSENYDAPTTISHLYSGKSTKYQLSLSNHNEHYAGDGNILSKYISQLHNDKNNLKTIEIQIHNIEPKHNDQKFPPTYMYSLKWPNDKNISYIKTKGAMANA